MGRNQLTSDLLGIEQMKLFARLEANGFSRRDGDFSAGARVAPDAGLARPDVENPKAAQFDAITGGKRLFQALKNGINSRFRFVTRQPRPVDHLVNNVLFDQCLYPEGSLDNRLAATSPSYSVFPVRSSRPRPPVILCQRPGPAVRFSFQQAISHPKSCFLWGEA